jgi:succinate dehydrogenase flavin-adding protein (antitoxin of CptAB toxin-antitoxin module)
MKELDVLLERWLERHAATAEPDEIRCFEAMLGLQDTDPATAALIERIRRA